MLFKYLYDSPLHPNYVNFFLCFGHKIRGRLVVQEINYKILLCRSLYLSTNFAILVIHDLTTEALARDYLAIGLEGISSKIILLKNSTWSVELY